MISQGCFTEPIKAQERVKTVAESKFAELKEKEKETRKQIVVESSKALFAKKPFYEVGMREVAEEAGISPATIYRYFASQEELFHEAFIQEIDKASTAFKDMVQKEEPAGIEDFALAFVDLLIENESTFQMMTYLMLKNNLTNPVLGRFDSVTKIFFDLFEQLLIKNGAKAGSVRLYAHSFIASLAGILMTFRNYPLKNKKAVQDHIHKLVRVTSSLYADQLIKR